MGSARSYLSLFVFATLSFGAVSPAHAIFGFFRPGNSGGSSGPAAITNATGANLWVVKKTSWSAQDEKNFQDFIRGIGQAVADRKCRSTEACLLSPANPYRHSDPQNFKRFADCAYLPYFLRAYFAWKNQLPMSFAGSIVPLGKSSDVRYSGQGNGVKSKKTVFTGYSGPQVINSIMRAGVSSAAFRMEYDAGGQYAAPDFYSAKINREAVVPGTMIYDPNGHVAIVYKVTDDGRVHYIDAHPDNSITSGIYSPKFVRSNPRHGAGFKNWRPFKIVNAQTNSRGEIINGQTVFAKNSEIPDFGTEQYYGNQPNPDQSQWRKGLFTIEGRVIDYYDYVRVKLAKGNLVINPVQDFKEILEDICVAIQDRVPAVQEAVIKGISAQGHPARLPHNIYGTDGDWESFSTPSRDARLKTSFVDLMNQTRSYFVKLSQHDPTVKYDGKNLKADLIQAYKQFVPTCQISYQKSNGENVTLDFEQVRQRLFDLSFDPYHCSELRWGARGQELASCQDGSNKKQWYEREMWLRNQIERTYDARMDYSLDQLTGPRPGAGVATAPDVDVITLIKSM